MSTDYNLRSDYGCYPPRIAMQTSIIVVYFILIWLRVVNPGILALALDRGDIGPYCSDDGG